MRGSRLAKHLIVLLFALVTFACADAQEESGRSGDGGATSRAWVHDLSSPRSTARGFLMMMQLAGEDRPEEIASAVRYLDVEWIPEEERESESRRLAVQLFEILDDLALDLNALPDVSVLREIEVQTFEPLEPGKKAPILSLTRHDKSWRFSALTLEHLDEIESAVEAQMKLEVPQEEVGDVSLELRSPRATMRTFLEAMDTSPPDLDRATRCLQPDVDLGAAWPVIRADQAHRLYAVLLRARDPLLSTIPQHLGADHYVWYIHPRGRVVLQQIQADDPELGVWQGEWRFSTSTLARLDELYAAHVFEPRLPMVDAMGLQEHPSLGLRIEKQVPPTLHDIVLGLKIWQWIGALAIFALLVLAFAGGVLTAWAAAPLFRLLRWEMSPESRQLLGWAIGLLVASYTLHRFATANTLLLPAGIVGLVFPLSRTLFLVSILWVALRVVSIADAHYQDPDRIASARLANLLIPVLQSAFRLFIGFLVIAFVLRLLGLRDSAVLGALGLIGAAFGFAARETLANIVAALSLIYDRPFRVGDWVEFEGTDATVERVGLVTTRLRTFYNSVVAVPNSKFVIGAVDNYGERKYRRLKHYLRLRYDTPADKIDALCEGLRELVRLHPWTRKDYYHVYLNELTPTSANVLVYVFFEVPNWATELRERHRFLLDTLALVSDLGIELAYPTQRLLVEEVETGDGPEQGEPGPAAEALDGSERAAALFHASHARDPGLRDPVVIQTSPLSSRVIDGGDAGGD